MISNIPLNVVITGATGMVGEGVLLECLNHPQVNNVLVINRKPCGVRHDRLKEIIHADFFDISPILASLVGYNACFFCAGVSSVGLKEPEYYRLTHTLTLTFARQLSHVSPAMTFVYVSGKGTDSSEKGGSMWARVKGKTENDLMKLPFEGVYCFRPGFMKPTAGQKNVLSAYKYIGWLYPVLHRLLPGLACTLREVGIAMIRVGLYGYRKPVLEVTDMVALARETH